MKEETRVMIAFVLALLVIVFFSMTSKREKPQQTQEKSTQIETSESVQSKSVEPIQSETNYVISNNQVKFGNELYTGYLDLLGGKIVSFSLSQYTRPGEKEFMFFQNGIMLADEIGEETGQSMYSLISEPSEKSLILRSNRNNIDVQKKIEVFPSKYTLSADLQIKNTSKEKLIVPAINLYLGCLVLNRHNAEDSVVEFLVTNGGKPYKFNAARQMKEKVSGNVCAVRTRYQMYYFKTDMPVEFNVENRASRLTWGLKIPSFEILPGEIKSFPLSCYVGPSDYFVARNEIKDIRIFGTGFFVSMGRIIFAILNAIYRVIPNWGWAIIVLTILIKVLFFPLTRNSLRSMKQMQKLRPYLQDIQKKYKDNPQMMQKEMMNLYKEYKINPFGGCLPMLIQLPIFVGFFLALRGSIFLRGSRFILWINDLSVPDTVATIGSVPINVLPILMFVSSFIQQRMTPAVEQSQKFMNILLPLMMLVLFYSFSSGLLLYWVCMNILGVFEQYYIYKISKN